MDKQALLDQAHLFEGQAMGYEHLIRKLEDMAKSARKTATTLRERAEKEDQ